MAEETRRDELFRRVMADYASGLWRLTAGYARTDADREDLYQEVLLAVWGALPEFRDESSLRTYVFRIGHNRGISHRRRQTRRPLPVSLEGLISSGPSPESEAMAGTLRAELLEAIRALPHGRRQVMMLHMEGLAPREIGEVLGITPNHVSVRLHRARADLRRRLDLEFETGG